MSFNIEAKPTFKLKIVVPVPGGAQGDLDATFQALTISEFNKYDLGNPDQVTALLKAAVVRLDDIVGEDGELIPWSPALADRLFDLPWVRTALFEGYLEGVGQATRKN